MKLAITADWHLSSSNRLDDMAHTLDAMSSAIVASDVDAVAVCGDLYRSWFSAGPMERGVVYRFVKTVTDAGKTCLLFPGNHDVSEADATGDTINSREFRELHLTRVVFCDAPRLVTIAGAAFIVMPHLTRAYIAQSLGAGADYSDAFASSFHGLYSQAELLKLPVYALCHVLLREALPPVAAESESLRSISASMFSRKDCPQLQGVFAGDIHAHKTISADGAVPVTYCGSPDVVTFGEINDAKGYVVLDTQTGKTEFYKLSTRKFLDVVIDLDADTLTCAGDVQGSTPMDSEARLDQEIVLSALAAVSESITDAIVRVSIKGTKDRVATIDRAAIRDALVGYSPNGIKSLNFVINYAETSSAQLPEAATDEDALTDWVKAKTYDAAFMAKVLAAGKGIICGLKG